MGRAAFGLAWGLLALAAIGCAQPPSAPPEPAPPNKIYASTLARRMEGVRVGMSAPAVLARLGSDRVRRPGSGGASYPTPLRTFALYPHEASPVTIELYVVGAHRSAGCPDVHVELAPLVFVDGVVVATDWDFIEARWRSWGGELEELRAARTLHECPLQPGPPAPETQTTAPTGFPSAPPPPAPPAPAPVQP